MNQPPVCHRDIDVASREETRTAKSYGEPKPGVMDYATEQIRHRSQRAQRHHLPAHRRTSHGIGQSPREYVQTAFTIRRTGHVSFVLRYVCSSGCSDRQMERDPIEASGAKARMPGMERIGHPCVLRSPAIGVRKRKIINAASRNSGIGGLNSFSQWVSPIG